MYIHTENGGTINSDTINMICENVYVASIQYRIVVGQVNFMALYVLSNQLQINSLYWSGQQISICAKLNVNLAKSLVNL